MPPTRFALGEHRVTEHDVVVDEVADRLHAAPARRRELAKSLPGGLGQPIGLAIAAAQQIDQDLSRQILHGVLAGPRD